MRHHRAKIICLIVLMSAGFVCPARTAETTGLGDIEFFLDGAVFRGSDGAAVQEIYIRIPNSELRFKETDGKWESRVTLSFTVKDKDGRTVVGDDEEVRFYEDTESEALDGLRFHTIIKKFGLEAGEYDLSCRVTDQYAPKVSLLGIVRGSHKSSEVEYYPLMIPTFDAETMSVSGAKFLWDVEGERVFHPNSSRLYGLHRDSLRVYIEAYVPAELVESETITFGIEVLDPEGQIAREAALPLPKLVAKKGDPLVTYPIVIQEDINTLAAGSYTLYVNAGLSDQLLVRMQGGVFHVAWDMRTWEISRRDYMTEARFLLSGRKELGDFENLSMGEQEQVLEAMWKELDPDPSTGHNEAYQKFLARLAYVRQRYTDYQTGIFNDRGLIYLRYGPPDEMQVDVVPKNRESISDAIQMVEDKYHPLSYSNTGARLRYVRPGSHIEVDPRRLGVVGEQGNVGYAYELWIYDGGGDPIREQDKAMEQDIGMRFIFVDTDGYGRYKLESSSIMMSK